MPETAVNVCLNALCDKMQNIVDVAITLDTT